ncbi:hypothetical protein SAMN04488072_101406 [Lentibacillus halodurans]|uniref:Uncharacterized protein n=1 Tax=Lentibacillus halodurans TaxID=237679 RepID=A0A1I0VGP3_9BACI|nr:hypothetical protein [Lentibacillus halodurans]SFA75482.1 hypothetical protein SAMN04488072_101406 [Lentibacillus halodurans]
MAFGIDRHELKRWKTEVENGHISFLTHYWIDERFPGCDTVTKVGCSNLKKLTAWGAKYNLKPIWIHMDQHHPHFDLFGEKQARILRMEKQWDQINKFKL